MSAGAVMLWLTLFCLVCFQMTTFLRPTLWRAPNAPVVERGKLKLKLRGKYRDLAGERIFARLRQLARLIGREPGIVTD